jgi:hypothetical protein
MEIAQWRERKIIQCEWKKFLDKKWMAKIAQWRERKLVRVTEKKFWMKMDG